MQAQPMEEKVARTLRALRRNRMAADYVATTAEIVPLLERLLPAGAKCALGGSESLKEAGVLELLHSGKYELIDRYEPGLTPEQTEERVRAGLTADVFLCSSNAVTERGELVNVDGRSNRCAALLYGPKRVFLVVGVNKIVPDVAAGLERVKTIAAPRNAERLGCATGCRATGKCVTDEPFAGCASEGRICSNYVISAMQRTQDRIHVILCGEPLGY